MFVLLGLVMLRPLTIAWTRAGGCRNIMKLVSLSGLWQETEDKTVSRGPVISAEVWGPHKRCDRRYPKTSLLLCLRPLPSNPPCPLWPRNGHPRKNVPNAGFDPASIGLAPLLLRRRNTPRESDPAVSALHVDAASMRRCAASTSAAAAPVMSKELFLDSTDFWTPLLSR